MKNNDHVIGIIGLGYVGLPLSLEFGKHFKTIGYDINQDRVEACSKSIDLNGESSSEEFHLAKFLSFTNNPSDIKECNIYIIAVPTPVSESKLPDFEPLIIACEMIGDLLGKEDIVIFESTVYPGATEEICVPQLERSSGLIYNKDFFVGYSPERINPGDKVNKLSTIVKVTSGSNPEVADIIASLYSFIVKAGVYKAPSLKVAEASKIIENIQRDINIAFMNEMYMLFSKLDIDIHEVLKASKTKWNFLNFHPGFVGGHCISVDPYYLIEKAGKIGFLPDILLASRKINESIPIVVSEQLLERIDNNILPRRRAKILILGFSFKPNCSDTRNTKVADLIKFLYKKVGHIDVYDPIISISDYTRYPEINFISHPTNNYDAILIAVAHDHFKEIGFSKIASFGKPNVAIFDYVNLFHEESANSC